MKYVCVKIFKIFFLFTALIFAVTGCGSSSSTANNETGSIAAKLIWSAAGAKESSKTLYAAPTDVNEVQIVVSAVGMASVSDFFAAAAGTGTLNGIPAGTGRTVTVNGLSSSGILLYQRVVTNVTINAGQVTNLGEITMAPITIANPVGGTQNMPFNLTLTSSVPATIYYTTNGSDPTSSSSIRGTGSTSLTFSVYSSPTTVKFFAFINYSAREATNTQTYRKP